MITRYALFEGRIHDGQTEAFRAALRDAIETGKDVVGVHGVYNMSPTDHFGHDERSRVLLKAENGTFKLISSK